MWCVEYKQKSSRHTRNAWKIINSNTEQSSKNNQHTYTCIRIKKHCEKRRSHIFAHLKAISEAQCHGIFSLLLHVFEHESVKW